MFKRYIVKDRNGLLLEFDSFRDVVAWVNGHPEDAPFQYWLTGSTTQSWGIPLSPDVA